MKICTKCGIEKDESEFHRNKTHKDGLAFSCKICTSEYSRLYYQNNREKLAKQQAQWRKDNKEAYTEQRKEYRETNREKVSESVRKWHKENRGRVISIVKEWRINNREKYLEQRRKHYHEHKHLISEQRRKHYRGHKHLISERRKESRLSKMEARGIHQISYAEEVRDVDGILEVRCTYCGKWFAPTVGQIRNRVRGLENIGRSEGRLYCSKPCKDACPIFGRVSHYKGTQVNGSSREVMPELRQMALERDDYACRKCGAVETQLHVHHIKAVADDPIESADLDNVITLCKACHKLAHSKEGCGYHELGRCG